MVMAKLGASTIFGSASCRRERTEGRDRSGLSLIWLVATLLMRLLPFRVVHALPSGGKAAPCIRVFSRHGVQAGQLRDGYLPRRSGEGVSRRSAYLASSIALTSSVTASSEVLI